MGRRTRGQIEAAISKAVVQFEVEQMGRGPADVRTYVIGDAIFVRLKGMLTPAERQLAQTEEGRTLIKDHRRELVEASRPALQAAIEEITGSKVISLFTDISTETGERIIVLTMADDASKWLA
ncbi:MAG: DUF2294 domain-containing protein [Anaerolineae bacterium]|nr:DUF2294 domain-containing protein [Anaerolineae bacterium]